MLYATPQVLGNNYGIGTIKALVSPLSYIKSAENTTVSSGGADLEGDEHLRERGFLAPGSFSVAGPDDAYKFWAMSAHQDVIDVAVSSILGTGIVNIFILLKDMSVSDAIKTSMCKYIENYLSHEKKRPLTDQVVVAIAKKVPFIINTDITLYQSEKYRAERIREEITAALKAYAAETRSRLGRDIVPSQIAALIQSVKGVYNVILSEPPYKKVKPEEWPCCLDADITINIAEDGEDG